MKRKNTADMKVTINMLCEAVARNLRDFGYPDAKGPMIREVWEAMKQGKTKFDLPHGIVGMFAESQINDHREKFDAAARDERRDA